MAEIDGGLARRASSTDAGEPHVDCLLRTVLDQSERFDAGQGA